MNDAQVKAIFDQIEGIFGPVQPKKIEIIVRYMSEEIDPLQEMSIPEDVRMRFVHILVTGDEWKRMDRVELANIAENGVDELNGRLMRDIGDILVGSLHLLGTDAPPLPKVLRDLEIPIDRMEYKYYSINCK
jgi:hypothetical protein